MTRLEGGRTYRDPEPSSAGVVPEPASVGSLDVGSSPEVLT